MNIVNIFCQSLSVTSHVKTFLTVCRFQTDLVSVWTARGICSSKNCHPFEWLGLSVQKRLSSVWTAWAIHSKGKCDLFERLGLSVWKKLSSTQAARDIRSKKKLATVRATKATFKHKFQPSFNPKTISSLATHLRWTNLLFSRSCTLRSLFTNTSWIVMDLCSFVAIFAFILSIDYRQYIDICFVLYFSFFSNKFPKNNIFYLLCFCSLWACRTKLSYSLHVKNTKHETVRDLSVKGIRSL